MSSIIDLTGQRFGRLVVQGIYDKKNGNIRWSCLCDCGNVIPVYKHTLLRDNGTIKSCGCVYLDELKEHIGEKRDYLEIVGVKQIGRKGRVVVRCDCGKEKIMQLSQFCNKSIHSCGCIGIAKGKDNPYYKHGMSKTRIFSVYRDMFNRCYNQKDVSYVHYGARGIVICDEWLGDDGVKNFSRWSFENGYDENAPRGECTLDRIDSNGNYEPSNCRWVSMSVQANNKRNNNYYTIDGVTKTLSEWCREYGNLCVQSVYERLKRGMDIKTALTKPMQKRVSEMTEEELLERKRKALERDRKWRSEHKEQIQASRRKWIENNPEKNIQSKRRYEEKKKAQKKI